jgi:hypothetical protein
MRIWLREIENLSDTDEELVSSVSQKLEKTSVMRRRDQAEIS